MASRIGKLAMPACIVLVTCALYLPYLENPLLFDDFGLVDTDRPEYWDWSQLLGIRWYAYASFHWSMALFGSNLSVLHAGNLALHVLTSLLLFGMLTRLLEVVVRGDSSVGSPAGPSMRSLAFVAALAFALHPAATFAVSYLAQRTILIAALFSITSWWLLLEGVRRRSQSWLLGSALAYLLAALGKEHAVPLPLASLALLMLLGVRPSRETLRLLWRPAIAYTVVFVYVIYAKRAATYFGAAYEPNVDELLATLGIVPGTEHTLSVFAQALAYFDYLGHWLAPQAARMSIALEADFPTQLTAWPQVLGIPLFLAALLASLWLMTRGGRLGLLGFAFAAPALLFLVEFVPIRIQDAFVLYRSYLWMPALACIVPVLLHRVDRRVVIVLALPVLGYLFVASTHRLQVLSDPIQTWDEAYRLGSATKKDWNLARILHNRGVAYLDRGRYDEARADLDEVIRLSPRFHNAYHDRAVVHFEQRNFDAALVDFSQAILLRPDSAFHYYGRAHVYLALGLTAQARQDLGRSCSLGSQPACARLGGL